MPSSSAVFVDFCAWIAMLRACESFIEQENFVSREVLNVP